jgi:hypothetical protein
MTYTPRRFRNRMHCQFCGHYYCDAHQFLHDNCEDFYYFWIEEIRGKLIEKLNIVDEIQRRFSN